MAKKQVIIVEDESIVAKDIKNTLEMMGYDVPKLFSSGEDILDQISEYEPDLILMDIMLKGDLSGIDTTERLLENIDVPVVYLTAYSDEKTLQKIKKTESYGYILKPFKEVELKTTIEMALHKHKTKSRNNKTTSDDKQVRKLNVLSESLLKTISTITELKCPNLSNHGERCAELSKAIAKELKLTDEQIKAIEIASFLQNIGYFYLSSEILTKPGELNATERMMIQSHTQSGYDILKKIDYPYPIANIVLQHHERADGSGYPNALKQEDIMIEAQIIGIADTVCAMIRPRAYRDKTDIYEIMNELEGYREKLFSEKLVDTCIMLFRDKNFTFSI